MTVTVSGTLITFNDGTTQNTATRYGSTDNTYVSGTSNFTLTATSTALQRFLLGGSNPTNPSVTLPSMTTMQKGNIFTLFNSSSYNPAVKDNGGTIREFLPSTSPVDISLFDNSTANGVWASSQAPLCTAANPGYDQTITGYKVGTGTLRASTFIRISATEIVQCWSEQNTTTLVVYAKLYTLNTSTNQLTAGNQVTLQSATSVGTSGSSAVFYYDCDNAGHALLFWNIASGASGNFGYGSFAGLSVSGGVLYASTTTTVSRQGAGVGCCVYGIAQAVPMFIGYLGSNSAYALSFVLTDGVAFHTQYYYSLTVTGTTTVTVTVGTGSSTLGLSATTLNVGASRTSLTTFTFNSYAGSAPTRRPVTYTYTPGTNTMSVTTRTTVTDFLASESGSSAIYSSFAQGGFAYNSAGTKIAFGPVIYDVTNAGAATVSVAVAANVYTKPTFSTGYKAGARAGGLGSPRTTLYTGGTQILLGDYFYSLDTTSANMNISYANSATTISSLTTPNMLLSSTSAFYALDTVTSSVSSGSIVTRVFTVASPFIL